jgi:hypothetical protein
VPFSLQRPAGRAEVAKGRTLYVQTHTRTTKIDQRCVDRFAKGGHVVLKDGKDGKLLMASGRKFVDASLCRLVLQ